MQLSIFTSFHFKINVALENIYIPYCYLLNLSRTCGFGLGFFHPFSAFRLQQAAVSLSMVVNRAMLLLLLQRLGETNYFAV